MAEKTAPTREELSDRVFRALASRSRRKILLLLATGVGENRCCTGGEVCACDLSDSLGLSASTISHHMKSLQDAGLISSRKEGLWVYYALRPEAIEAVADELSTLAASCCR